MTKKGEHFDEGISVGKKCWIYWYISNSNSCWVILTEIFELMILPLEWFAMGWFFLILAVWSCCSNFLEERSIEAVGDDTAAVDNWSGGENSLIATQIQMGSCLFVSCLLLPRSHAIPRRMKDRNSRQQGIWRLSSHCGSQQREDCGIIHIGVSLKVWLICWFPLLNSSRSMSKRN